MQVVIIVQARMTSERLPGKVLKIVQGIPLIGYLLERLKRCKEVDEIVVATTTNQSDDIVVEFCEEMGATIYRGDEHDVLSRYYEAAKIAHADVVVRLTADCPLLDPSLIDEALAIFKERGDLCYLSNTIQRSYPRGLDIELIRFSALKRAQEEATSSYDREHVTPYIWKHPEEFKLADFVSGRKGLAEHRWTVDEAADLVLIKKVLESLYPVNPEFTMDDVLELFDRFPEWREINSHIEQKVL